MRTLSRREFLRVGALTTAATISAACLPVTPPAALAEPTAAPPIAPPEVGKYQEAPLLAEMVAKGELPPVDERLPENPFAIEGLDGIGNYGGTWRMQKRGQADGFARGQVLNRGTLNFNAR